MTDEREVFRGCSHLMIFRPPILLPPRSFPPLGIRTGCSGRPWRLRPSTARLLLKIMLKPNGRCGVPQGGVISPFAQQSLPHRGGLVHEGERHIGMFVFIVEGEIKTEMTMKMLALIALSTAIASPAIAQAPQARHQSPMIVQPQAHIVKWPAVRAPRAFARAPRHSANPAWDVYGNSGRYKGSDPDPLVRDEIRRDRPNAGDD